MKEKTLNRWLYFFMALNCLYLFVGIFISGKAVADDFEHLHAGWLVWNGFVPYTDFFEHHNPLLWYLFAPFIGIWGRSVFVFFAVRFIVALVSLATLYIIYRLVRDFLADKTAALLSVNIFCFSNTALNSMVLFKPDAFMQLCFFAGVYAFFMYVRDRKLRCMVAASVLFTVGFLFLQTILFLLLPLCLAGIVLLCQKKIRLKDVVYAFIPVVVILAAAVAFLYGQGNLQRYYELNWIVNGRIATAADERIADFSELYWILALGAVSGVLLLRKAGLYVKIWILMYVTEFLLRAFYFSVGLYYFKILLLYNAVLLATGIIWLYRLKKYIAYAAVAVMFLFSAKFWLFEDFGEINVLTVVGVANDIARNSSAEDIVLGTNNMPFGIFSANPHYYWFSWKWVGKIDAGLFHYAEPFDINTVITEKKPLFVYFEDDLKEEYAPSTPYDIRPELLQKLYRQAKYTTLYQRID